MDLLDTWQMLKLNSSLILPFLKAVVYILLLLLGWLDWLRGGDCKWEGGGNWRLTRASNCHKATSQNTQPCNQMPHVEKKTVSPRRELNPRQPTFPVLITGEKERKKREKEKRKKERIKVVMMQEMDWWLAPAVCTGSGRSGNMEASVTW